MRLHVRCVRWFWIGAGTLFTAMGILGVVLPLVPAMPFLLLAAYAYAKGSPRLHAWLLGIPWLGAYIKSWQEGKGIPLKSKILAVLLIMASTGYSVFFFAPFLLVKIVLALVALAVSWYIVTRPTARK